MFFFSASKHPENACERHPDCPRPHSRVSRLDGQCLHGRLNQAGHPYIRLFQLRVGKPCIVRMVGRFVPFLLMCSHTLYTARSTPVCSLPALWYSAHLLVGVTRRNVVESGERVHRQAGNSPNAHDALVWVEGTVVQRRSWIRSSRSWSS